MSTFAPTKSWYRKPWGMALLIGLCLFFAVILAFGGLIFKYWQAIKTGQGDSLRRQFYAGQDQSWLTNETAEIKKARTELETIDDPFLGNQAAPLVIVEFIDFKCPICLGQAPEMQKLIGKYGSKIKWIVRDFPMESVHTGASRLAEMASCANEQGGFWIFHDYFFAKQDKLGATFSDAEAVALAEKLGLAKAKFADCLKAGRGRIEANKDYADAIANGVTKGTPTFFVNGRMLESAVPFEKWEELFKNLGL